MKIAVLTCGMLPIPAVQGGAVENLIDFYLEYNDKHKLHDITVYSPWNEKLAHHPALKSEVNHYVFIDVTSLKARIGRRIYKYIHSSEEYYNHFIEYYFEKVYANLKTKDFDYIILENGAGLAYKLGLRGYKNLILHMHNEVRPSRNAFHQVVFNNIAKIIAVSDFIREKASAYYPIENIQTVHNGIDLEKFSPNVTSTVSRQQLGFKPDDFIISFNGRIIQEKGISELISSMLLLKDYPSIKLMIIGSTFFDGSAEENDFIRLLKNKAESIKDRIVFTGFIPYHQIPNYLHLADISVLPSMWNEPFGLTIVESMSVGLPLITTRAGGIPEICEGIATIIEKDDHITDLIASAIIDLYEHPEKRKQMAAASLERAKQFDKVTYAQNFFAALETIG